MDINTLKFRAWNQKLNNMYYFIFEELESNCIVVLGNAGPTVLIPLSECVIQRYTGLQDNYLKDLYEGDILKMSRNYIPITYDNNDMYRKEPVYGEYKVDIEYGEVVFDSPTDQDDFYTKPMVGWCLKMPTTTTSLLHKLDEYNPKYIHTNTYYKDLYRNICKEGSVFETPQFLKDIYPQ